MNLHEILLHMGIFSNNGCRHRTAIRCTTSAKDCIEAVEELDNASIQILL